MTGALFLVGGCQLVAAAGLAGVRLPARVLLVVAGLSSIGIAAFPNPLVGRPRRTSPGLRSARSHSRCGLPSSPGARRRGR